MKRFRWLFWIVVFVFAAALPWIVNGFLNRKDGAPPRNFAEQAVDYLRESWLGLAGSHETDGFGSGGSDRSREVAARIKPRLEAELAEKNLKFGAPVFIRIFKESNELEVWIEPGGGREFDLFKTYEICRWSGKLGPKLKEGDHQAPEGFYHIGRNRMNPRSNYHLSFDLGFPNEYDQHHQRSGSFLMIHGGCLSIGCYAMSNENIEEIYTLADAALAAGQKFFRVQAFPFRMTDDRMDELDEEGKWFEYWANLKEGFDFFEMLRRPPDVRVEEGDYAFHLTDA